MKTPLEQDKDTYIELTRKRLPYLIDLLRKLSSLVSEKRLLEFTASTAVGTSTEGSTSDGGIGDDDYQYDYDNNNPVPVAAETPRLAVIPTADYADYCTIDEDDEEKVRICWDISHRT